jgi:glutathione S-transferase
MLKLFHSPQSRSSRFLWLLEELGQPYEIEYVTIRRGDGTGEADPKNPNPDGKVPTLLHDGRLVMESAAITLYLTDAFPGAGLGPAVGDPLRGDYLTWLAYYAAEVEPALIAKFTGRIDKDEREAKSYDQMVRRFLGALDKGPFMLGQEFTAADVLYGSVVQWGAQMLPSDPRFDAYLARLNQRPALKRSQAKDAPQDASQSAGEGVS